MSPNSSRLDSYQHNGPEHKALYLTEVDDVIVDDGEIENNEIGIKSNGNIILSSEKRNTFPSLLIFSVACLSLVVGWCASNTLPFGINNSNAKHEDGLHQGWMKYNNGGGEGDAIPSLVWSDEFHGDSLDLEKWTFVNGNGCDVGLCGWGNNELEWYTPSNTIISNGTLTITAKKFVTHGSVHPVTYTSSKIISRGKADFGVIEPHYNNVNNGSVAKSRRFEASIRLSWGRGIWPAFWMLPTADTYGGWPQSGEIDIMENIGKEGPNTVHGTVHYGLAWPQHQYSESGITLSAPSSPNNQNNNLNETFHTYAVERLPGEIRWFVDDIKYSSITKKDMEPYHWPFDEEFYFLLNLAVGGSWPGNPVDEEHRISEDGFDEATLFPQTLEFDYVRVYEDVFPRVVGKSIVDCLDKNVVYEVANNIEEFGDGITLTWSVPSGATITKGQGTSRIHVDFDVVVQDGGNMNDSEVIRVQVSGFESHVLSNSIGLTKLQKSGIGLRIKVVDFDAKCSSSGGVNATVPSTFDFDCGRPDTCTQYVLQRTTEEYTCGERIQWLIDAMGMSEKDACREVGFVQFHGHCGPCNPLE